MAPASSPPQTPLAVEPRTLSVSAPSLSPGIRPLLSHDLCPCNSSQTTLGRLQSAGTFLGMWGTCQLTSLEPETWRGAFYILTRMAQCYQGHQRQRKVCWGVRGSSLEGTECHMGWGGHHECANPQGDLPTHPCSPATGSLSLLPTPTSCPPKRLRTGVSWIAAQLLPRKSRIHTGLEGSGVSPWASGGHRGGSFAHSACTWLHPGCLLPKSQILFS